MGDPNPLSTPLLPHRRPVFAQTSDRIILRIAFLALLGTLAVWATREDSKGFRITVVNDLPLGSRAGQRFDLFYVSNGLATRVLLNASDFVQSLLRHGETKPVSRVTLRLAGDDLPDGVPVVVSREAPGEFVVDLSPKLMDAPEADVAFRAAVLRGMARVWVADGGSVPREIVTGLVEYIAIAAGFGGNGRIQLGAIRCGKDYRGNWFTEKDPRFVARILARCEEEESGFIGRLNAAMIRDGWRDRTVEDALENPASMCLCVAQ